MLKNFRERKLSKNIEKHKVEMKAKFKGEDVTIISNNCLAGVIYNILGREFCSPTINQWMKMAEYLEFVSNLEYYMNCDLIVNQAESDLWKYPVGTLMSKDNKHNSLNIYFNHYKIFEDAKEKWEDRKKRIKWDKIYVIYDFNDKDCDINLLYQFDKLPLKHKIALVHKNIPNLQYSYRMKCIGENDPIIKEFEYDGCSGRRFFEEWDYCEFLKQ